MRRLLIVCEGPTEQEFCKDILLPHFVTHNIHVNWPLIKRSAGGIVAWDAIKHQIETHLKEDNSCYVTTLIDLYGIQPHHNFPGWSQKSRFSDKIHMMDFLEDGMLSSINPALRGRFVPYIQLHEFEGLLLNDISVFDENFTAEEIVNRTYLLQTITSAANPELINDGPTTAPSKRLIACIKGYNKIVYGSLLADYIGLSAIRDKCERFDNWISKLESL